MALDRLSGSALATHDYQQEDGSHASGFLGVYMAVGNESAMRPKTEVQDRSRSTKLKGYSSFGPGSCLSREISRQSRKLKSLNQVSALGLTVGEVSIGPLSALVKVVADQVSAMNDAATASGGYRKGMAIFTIATGGLMFEASLAGQKFTYSPL